jgi:hypothetical protein
MARDVARRGVGRTEVDDDLVAPPKYLERRGTVVVARPVLGCFWAVAWAALVGPCWAAAAGKPFSIFFSLFPISCNMRMERMHVCADKGISGVACM